jgi:glycosyltransferase involved in cell wall biosynthesis
MSLGVPVVASRVGGVPDLLSDGVEGRLVPPGDPALLMDAVVQIVTNTSLRQKMGAAGRARADAFQLNVVVEAIEAVYRDAMELYCARSGRYA